MSAASLVARLREHGHRVRLDGPEIVIRPRPDFATLAEVRACRDEMVDYLQRTPPASDHRYVLWRGVVDRSRSVCLSCGIPPPLHGANVFDDPVVLDDPNDAVLFEACAIVAAAAAEAGS